MISLGTLLEPFARASEEALERWLIEPGTVDDLAAAMRYCVMGGGKRLRPALVLMSCKTFARELDNSALAASAAIEMIHCYSLVHDDLPAMDNDTLRRGQPTAHVKFGQAMAILAGDALLTRAFGVLAETRTPLAGPLAMELARAAGGAGMIAGQVADMGLCSLDPGVAGLRRIHQHKTADLIRCAVRMGAICGRASAQELETISRYGDALGLAFQLVDDLLDVTGQAAEIGKTPGKDQAAGKLTYVSLLGLAATKELARQTTNEAITSLEPLGPRARVLRELARLLGERTH